jgi:hypothetical protein
MKKMLLQSMALCIAMAQASSMAAEVGEFSFGVISHPFQSASVDSALREAIEETDADNLAFVVANGIKAADEPCTDKLYNRRKELLQAAKNGMIVSLAASDWAECRNENGKSVAIGKLNRLRDLFFGDEFSLGASKIPVIRQSMTAKFRSFVENARWEIGETMFATINLPRNNNHYISDAGRNSEFEDRLVANRDWLHRIFAYATRRKLDGIVLFCDANPLSSPGGTRDGYVETRRQIRILATEFPGKTLIVHDQATEPSASTAINWQGKLGELDTGSGRIKLTVNPSQPALFSVANALAQATGNRQ